MADLPVVCDNCGGVFRGGGIIGSSGTNVTVVDNTVSPCPYCGGSGHIPNGVYDFVDGAIRAVWSLNPTPEDLRALLEVVGEAQAERLSSAETADRVQSLGDRFKAVSEFIKHYGLELGLLPILVSVVQLLASLSQSSNVTVNVEQPPAPEVVIRQLPPSGGPVPKLGRPNVGRNDRCPCGSGRKYKHCHGGSRH